LGLAAYVPLWVRELAQEGADPSRGSSERRLSAALLLVDIVGFKALTEQLTASGERGAERLREVLNRYFGELSSLVAAHGGDTATFAGDALLAFWPAETGDTRAACRLAAGCALSLRQVEARVAAEFAIPLRQRLAIDVGVITLHEIQGSPERRFALVTGEPLTRLAATCRAASPESVRVGRDAWRLLREHASGWAEEGGEAVLTACPPGPAPERPSWGSTPDQQLACYLPKHLVERLRAGQGEWHAELRTLTLVFLNFGPLDVTAPTLSARLEDALRFALGVEGRTGGSIYQFLMDDKGLNLILAYGLPLHRQEDDAARAVDAACQLREGLTARGFAPAVGVASGQSFCGNCGERRRQFSIIGAPINRAAQLMLDAAGEVSCDEATASAVAAHFELEASVSGFRRPRRRTIAARPGASGALVGRERELHVLLERVSVLCQGRGGFLTVEGDAGFGKSRLLSELCQALPTRGVRLLHGAATSLEQGTPYYLWREPLQQLLSPSAKADGAQLGERLLFRLAEHPELVPRAPLLADILPLRVAGAEQSQQPSGVGRLAAIHQLLSTLLHDAAAEGPTVLILDDLHWVDPSSLEALVAVARGTPRLLIVGGLRTPTLDEALERQLASLSAERLRLEPLTRDALGSLIALKLETGGVPSTLTDFAYERTAGHPFFCEELVLSLRDTGAVTVRGGECLVTEHALERAATKVPDTLQGVIVSRVDRLPMDEQLAIKVAGVIGRRFPLRMLRELYPIATDESELTRVLDRLVAHDLLQVTGTGADRSYGFKHVIAQESVAGLVLFAQRKELHGNVARWLERNHAADLEPHCAELAQHWELADDVQRALDYLERAGEMALARYANTEAVKAVRRAFDLSQAHSYPLSAARQARWESLIGHAWHELSDSVRAAEHFERALSLSGRRVAKTPWQVALGVSTQLAIQLCRRLGLLAPGTDQARAELAHIFTRLGEHWYFENDSFRVLYATLSSLNHAEASSSRRVVDGFGAMGIGLGIAGLDGLAQYYVGQAVARAEQLGSAADVAYAQLLSGVCAAGRADWQPMNEALEQASTLYKQLGDPFRFQQSRSILCFGALVRGDYVRTEQLLSEIAAETARVGFVQVRAWTWSARMALSLAQGAEVSQHMAELERIPTTTLPLSERLLCTGLLAQAQLCTGARAAARRSADSVLASMRQSPPTAWHVVPGIKGVAETYLGLLESNELGVPERADLLQQARRACRAITEFARRSRSCRPLALRVKARLLLQEGQHAQARTATRESVRAARALSLDADARIGERELQRMDAEKVSGSRR